MHINPHHSLNLSLLEINDLHSVIFSLVKKAALWDGSCSESMNQSDSAYATSLIHILKLV